ncbi:12780_t:CDS:1 [Ambispora leptoticha]|uniref:12780_t:CDS:1 n=1 Tax=Ambispora leptoticha TaxID=144679 RepID=A0A9N9BJD0_9GLOM|nr:12780_t:CDS:1 [Ambispora leptoticha]
MSILFFPSFPPNIDLNQLIKPMNRKQKKPLKAPNAFIIYRTNYCREISKIRKIPQPKISSMASQAWKLERQYVKEKYYDLAKQAREIYLATKNHGNNGRSQLENVNEDVQAAFFDNQPENMEEDVQATMESDVLIDNQITIENYGFIDNQLENVYENVQATFENDAIQQNGVVEEMEIITEDVSNPHIGININSEPMNMQNRIVTLENKLVSMRNEMISMRQAIAILELYTLFGI